MRQAELRLLRGATTTRSPRPSPHVWQPTCSFGQSTTPGKICSSCGALQPRDLTSRLAWPPKPHGSSVSFELPGRAASASTPWSRTLGRLFAHFGRGKGYRQHVKLVTFS